MAGATSDLTNRAKPAALPASPGAGVAGPLTELTRALTRGGNGCSEWRTVELWSTDGLPWQAFLTWSGGQGGTRSAQIVVASATRICINANSVFIQAANLAPTVNNVWCAIEDGHEHSANQWTTDGTVQGAGSVDTKPPPFASFVRLELSDNTLYNSSFVELYDGNNVLRARYRGDQQPNPGIPVGDALNVRAVLPGATNYRLTFLLGL